MRSRPLTLVQLHQGLYDPTTACAYIYYGSPENPVDQNNQAIAEFLSDTRRAELTHHVLTIIMPQISDALQKSDYQCNDIEFENMSPHPCLLIKRKDSKILCKDDISKIDKELQSFLKKHSLESKIQDSSAMLFATKNTHHSDQQQTPTSQNRYNLRSNRR